MLNMDMVLSNLNIATINFNSLKFQISLLYLKLFSDYSGIILVERVGDADPMEFVSFNDEVELEEISYFLLKISEKVTFSQTVRFLRYGKD